MDDTISRQAAIDAYGDWYVEEGTEEGFIGTVKQLLEGLPSAEPQRNKGKWIVISDGYVDVVKCDQCGKIADDISNYCPSCGADMREEQE